ncbi:MAG: winged helix-turn-helix domain-containing protein, partial [Gammaproteobacteria bacterium]
MKIQDQRAFFVDDWRVSPREGLLSRGKEKVRLEPKAMEVLVYLASRPGEVVTREELERDVWHGALVGYDAVTGTVIKLRKALRDSAREPRFIVTVPKRGYQLLAPVKMPEDARCEQGDATSPLRARATTGWSGIRLFVLAAGVLTLAWGAVWLSTTLDVPAQRSNHAAQRPSIAVLPFESLGDDPRQENLGDGMTEDLITDLSRSSSLLVIASNSSFAYKSRQVTPHDVARDLNVAYVVQGSIRSVGDAIRINVRLVDVKTGFNRWAARYDRKVEDIFAIQDDMTARIVKALDVSLTRQERQRLAQRATSSLRAYDLFLEGQALSKLATREALERARDAYRRAIEIDPSYGRAYGALGYALATTFRRGWTDAPMETADRALELAKKGVALDNSIPQTYWSLGYVRLFRREYEDAERAAEQSIAIAPNYADGYGLLALISNNLGKPKRAVELITKGMRLNPYYTWDYPLNLGWAYYSLGRYDDAVRELEKARQRNPNAVPVLLFLAASYVGAGRQDDAEWLASEIQMLSGTETITQIEKTSPIANTKYKRALLE